MTEPHITVTLRHGDKVIAMGSLSINEPPGSLSSTEPDGTRHVYVFGWRNDERGVWRSLGGVDQETEAFRAVHSVGLEKLSGLDEPFDLTIYRNGKPVTVRFTAVPATAWKELLDTAKAP